MYSSSGCTWTAEVDVAEYDMSVGAIKSCIVGTQGSWKLVKTTALRVKRRVDRCNNVAWDGE